MIWQRLKNMQCPTCNRVLEQSAYGTGYKCNCGFFVSNGKFEAIVDKLYKKGRNAVDEIEKNLSDLNNL